MAQRINPSIIELAVLALWLGAAGFMSVAVAPALFAVLPNRALAGAVVGRLLPAVFYSGMAIGLAVIAMQVATRRAWGGRALSALAMIVACAVAQLFVAPRIERIRSAIAGPIEDLPLDDARRLAFGRLHGISVAWLGMAMLAAVVAMVLSARSLQSDSDFIIQK
ncbi:MAG: hypothetical protein JWM41_2765 [Gemmatimonadetes bacterium]|nr:hypothetical protein [Gemmatimonadota bacterium]